MAPHHIAAARARGRKGGRKRVLGPKEVREIRALLRDPEVQVVDVARRYRVSRSTLYNYLGAARQAAAAADAAAAVPA